MIRLRRYTSEKGLRIKRLTAAAACVLALAAALAVMLHLRVREYADVVCTNSCVSFGEAMISRSIEKVCSEIDFDMLLAADGELLHVDANLVNRITSGLINEINKEVSGEMHSTVSIPAGAFTGLSFLSGTGPDITVDIFSVASPEVELETSFESAGINQTLFELKALITVRLTAVMPAVSVPVEVNREVILAQRIFVGEVPKAYFAADS